METLEEIKNCPLHTSDMASGFVCSESRDGEAFWFKSPNSCSWLNEWLISISLAPSILEAVFVNSTTWNLSLVPSRSCDSSSAMFSTNFNIRDNFCLFKNLKLVAYTFKKLRPLFFHVLKIHSQSWELFFHGFFRFSQCLDLFLKLCSQFIVFLSKVFFSHNCSSQDWWF